MTFAFRHPAQPIERIARIMFPRMNVYFFIHPHVTTHDEVLPPAGFSLHAKYVFTAAFAGD